MSRAEPAQLPMGGMAVAMIPAILTVAFLTLVGQKTYPMDTRGFTSVFQGSIRLNTYLGLAIAGGVMGAKGLEYAAYTAAVMITLVNFFECGDGGTVRGNEKRVVVPAQFRVGQPVDSGMCTGDGFQHFSLEAARSCLSKPGFSGRGFVTDGTVDRRSGTAIFQC